MLKKLNVAKLKEEEKLDEYDEPVSPTGQYFNSSVLSVAILGVFEFDIPIDDSPTWSTLENLLLPVNPRFSSIMVEDENGTKHWKRVNIKLEDHVHVPTFPEGLEYYDEYISEYLTKLSVEELPQNQPLWNLHIIKYPSKTSLGQLVFKLHHALGDGFSLMAALFSCLRRADDPLLPLTFPSSKLKDEKMKHGFANIAGKLRTCVNTVRDFGWSLLKSNWLVDDVCAVRSGGIGLGVKNKAMIITSVEFSLKDIRKIKMKTGGTINDVICGVVFYGTQLYLQAASEDKSKPVKNVTALVLLNTRMIENYKPLNEMTKADAESPWGNQFGFLHVGIPSCDDVEKADPLQFVQKARKIIKEKRNSLGVLLTGRLLEMLRKLIGPEGTAKYIRSTLINTTMTISNLTGPLEQIAIAGHPVRSFHFMVVGSPQSLTITVVSYMGRLKVAIGVEKGFINPNLFVSCMEHSFEQIYEAAVGDKL